MRKRSQSMLMLVGGGSAMAIALGSGAAWAQSVAPPPSSVNATSAPATTNEVVVTAQRRSEALQNVPIAVSAFSEAKLEAHRIDNGSQLVLDVPNVTFAQSYFGGFNFQIRGVGTQLGTASADSGVGIHLNNMPLTSSRFFEAELFDVGQVEVLRGPQGTLYGRNATGGVVNVLTAKPTDSYSGMLNVEAGNYGSFKVKGDINLPINDMLSFRLAGSYLTRSGFGENTQTGENVNGRDLYSTRATLSYHPNSRFTAIGLWEHFEESDDRLRTGGTLCTQDPGPASVGGVAVTNPIARGFLSQGCSDSSLYTAAAHGTPNSLGTLFGILPQLFGVTNGNYNAGKMVSSNLNDTDSFFKPKYKAKDDIFQVNLTYDLTPHLQVSSLTGYTLDGVNSFSDFFGETPSVGFSASSPLTPGGTFTDPQLGTLSAVASAVNFVQHSSQFTQELRLQSSFDGPLNVAVGGNILNYQTQAVETIESNIFTLTSALTNGFAPCALGNPTCIYIDPNAHAGTLGHNYYVNDTPYRLTSEALFGELYYNFTNDLKLTIGVRYTHDHKTQENIPVPLLAPGSGLVAGMPSNLVSDFSEPTGRIGLDWKLHTSFTDKTLLYAFYSRGYKAGGSNAPAAVGTASIQANFAPEFIDSYEIGLKNTLFGGRVTANLTGFYYNYSNYQVAEIVSETQVVQNVNAQVYGLEFEGAWRATPRLQFDTNVGLLHTRITDGAAIDPANITGGNVAQTLVKTSGGANCAVSTAALAPLLAIIQQQPGTPTIAGVSGNPDALLGVCSGAFSALGINPTQGTATQLSGKQLPNAPGWTVSLGAQYTWDLPGRWDATLRGDYYAQGDSYARIYNDVEDHLKGWDNVNATLTFRNPNGWQAQLFVKNLFDKQPIINTFLFDAITGLYTQGYTNDPRLFGANLTKKF
jgi:outer membrane receptor protein involved in Fe transport